MQRQFLITFLICTVTLAGFASGVEEIEPQQMVRSPGAVHIAALKGPTGVAIAKLMHENPDILPGTDITYELASSPQVLVGKLLSGEADVATIPTNLAAQLYNKGAKLKLAALTIWGVLYVVSTDDEVVDWQDLKGRTVYTLGRGATPDVVFRYLSEANGIDPDSDVTLDFSYNQVELAQLLIAGRIETALLPEPFVSNALLRSDSVHVAIDLQSEWRRVHQQEEAFAQTCVVISSDLAREYPDAALEVLAAIERSVEWVLERPVAAAAVVGDLDMGISPEVAIQAIPRLNLAYVEGNRARAFADQFLTVLHDYAAGSVGGTVPPADFYFPGD